MNWLRENTKSIIIFTVGAFVATIFFQWGMNYLGGQQQQRSLAEVNGEEITHSEYQQLLNQTREQYTEQNQGPITSEDMDEIRRQTFRQLVNRIILQQHLSDLGISASEQEIRAYIQRRYFTNEQGQIDQQRWQQFLNQASPRRKSELETAQRQQIETSRMQEWLTSKVSLSNLEFRQLLRAGLREANLYGILLKPGEYIDDERIQEYYLGNDQQFQAPPRARVRTILFDDAGNDSPAANRQEQLTDLKEQLDTIRRRFEAGDPFAKLAAEYSADTATRDNGGLIGWVTPQELSDRKSRAIFQLETGEMSNLVRTDEGYHLFYLEEGPVQEKQPLPAVRSEIVRTLRSDTHWTSARKEAKRLKDEISRSNQTFTQFRDSAVVYSHGKTASDGGAYGWVPSRFIVPSLHNDADTPAWQGEIANQAFVNQTISQAAFSDTDSALRGPVRTDYGIHLLYVRDERDARLDQLSDDDRERIRRVLEQEKRTRFLEDWLDTQRDQATIKLSVPEQQVGGPIDEL